MMLRAARLPCRNEPVNSATRASPFVKQMPPTSRAAARFTSGLNFYCSATAIKRIAQIHRAKVRTGQTTSGHSCSSHAADPDERRARGPHSLAADSLRCRLELNRHTPRRSNLYSSTLGASRGGSFRFVLLLGQRYWVFVRRLDHLTRRSLLHTELATTAAAQQTVERADRRRS